MKRVAKNLQVRNVPAEIGRRVGARAKERGQTISEYVTELIERDLERKALQDWLDELRRLPPIPHGMSGAQAVREARRLEEGLEP